MLYLLINTTVNRSCRSFILFILLLTFNILCSIVRTVSDIVSGLIFALHLLHTSFHPAPFSAKVCDHFSQCSGTILLRAYQALLKYGAVCLEVLFSVKFCISLVL